MRDAVLSTARKVVDWLLARPRAARLLLALIVVPSVVAVLARGVPRTPLLVASAIALALAAWLVLELLLRTTSGPGYDVTRVEHRWDFVHPDGSLVIHRRRMRLRFVRSVISVTDVVSDPLDQVSPYVCRPGRVVDRFPVGGETWVLVSLGELRRRGQEETLEFSHSLRDAFRGNHGTVQAMVPEGTRRLVLELVFPRDRGPEKVSCRFGKGAPQPPEVDELDGRRILRWDFERVRAGASCAVQWSWNPAEAYVSFPPELEFVASELTHRLTARSMSVRTSEQAEAGVTTGPETKAFLLLVDGTKPSERQRAEWSAALQAAWSGAERAVVVVLMGVKEPPPILDSLPRCVLAFDADERRAQLDQLLDWLWEPAELRAAERRRERPTEKSHALPVDALVKDRVADREALEVALVAALPEPPNPDRARLAYDLGLVLRAADELQNARTMFLRAIADAEASVGPGDPTVPDATYNLGVVLEQMGERREAKAQLKRAVSLGEQSLGFDHPKVRVYRSTLAELGR